MRGYTCALTISQTWERDAGTLHPLPHPTHGLKIIKQEWIIRCFRLQAGHLCQLTQGRNLMPRATAKQELAPASGSLWSRFWSHFSPCSPACPLRRLSAAPKEQLPSGRKARWCMAARLTSYKAAALPLSAAGSPAQPPLHRHGINRTPRPGSIRLAFIHSKGGWD